MASGKACAGADASLAEPLPETTTEDRPAPRRQGPPRTDCPGKGHPQRAAFLSCWQVYPVKQGEEEAWREWMRLYANGTLEQPHVIRDKILELTACDSRWQRGKIPTFARWLKGGPAQRLFRAALRRYGRQGPVYAGHGQRQVDSPVLLERARAFWERHKPHRIANPAQFTGMHIEDKASGTGLIQTLRAQTSIPVIAVQRNRDKVSRANDVLPYVAGGRLFIPEGTEWAEPLISELCAFSPAMTHAHDDQVDTVVDAITTLLMPGGGMLAGADWS